MAFHVCQIWGEDELLVIQACTERAETEAFLREADDDGRLRLWGTVVIIGEGSPFTPAQFLRSRRVSDVIDGLSAGRQRPGYGNEYARSLYELNPDNWAPLISYLEPAPNTLESDELPDDSAVPTGPNWHIRSQIRPWQEGDIDDISLAEKAEIAARRLALPTADDIRLQKAIASLASQLAQLPPAERPTPVPTVDDQVHELALEQERDFPIRTIKQ